MPGGRRRRCSIWWYWKECWRGRPRTSSCPRAAACCPSTSRSGGRRVPAETVPVALVRRPGLGDRARRGRAQWSSSDGCGDGSSGPAGRPRVGPRWSRVGSREPPRPAGWRRSWPRPGPSSTRPGQLLGRLRGAARLSDPLRRRPAARRVRQPRPRRVGRTRPDEGDACAPRFAPGTPGLVPGAPTCCRTSGEVRSRRPTPRGARPRPPRRWREAPGPPWPAPRESCWPGPSPGPPRPGPTDRCGCRRRPRPR